MARNTLFRAIFRFCSGVGSIRHHAVDSPRRRPLPPGPFRAAHVYVAGGARKAWASSTLDLFFEQANSVFGGGPGRSEQSERGPVRLPIFG